MNTLEVGICFDGAFAGTTGAASTFNPRLGVLIEIYTESLVRRCRLGLEV